MADLLILAHGGSWERRFQVSSLAASAAAAGQEVEVALFFDALAAWVNGRWDDWGDVAPPLSASRLEALGLPPLTQMLASGREEGRIRLYACSASTRFLDLEPARVQASVDAILGWQTFSKKVAEASRVVTL